MFIQLEAPILLEINPIKRLTSAKVRTSRNTLKLQLPWHVQVEISQHSNIPFNILTNKNETNKKSVSSTSIFNLCIQYCTHLEAHKPFVAKKDISTWQHYSSCISIRIQTPDCKSGNDYHILGRILLWWFQQFGSGAAWFVCCMDTVDWQVCTQLNLRVFSLPYEIPHLNSRNS